MDIKEAIDEIDKFHGFSKEGNAACDFTIAALEELQKYRQIGTVDECRAAMEKQIPMESSLAKISKYALIMRYSSCPSCLGVTRSALDAFPKYCSNCGQALKWGD